MSNPLLPEESAARKALPVCSGVLDYFPSALIRVAERSKQGNDQHNPGQPLHHARNKSSDHLDALVRHLLERDLVGVAWRALAALQEQEEANGAPLARGASVGEVPAPADDDGWHPWGGGEEPPVGNFFSVEVMLRGGYVMRGHADAFGWAHTQSEYDITRWRLAPDSTPPEEAP